MALLSDRPSPPGKPYLLPGSPRSDPDVITIKWTPPLFNGGSKITGTDVKEHLSSLRLVVFYIKKQITYSRKVNIITAFFCFANCCNSLFTKCLFSKCCYEIVKINNVNIKTFKWWFLRVCRRLQDLHPTNKNSKNQDKSSFNTIFSYRS